jgi:metallo-beta-lactamase family protein
MPETSVIIVGYQAEDTRGRKLLEGANEIKIHGKYHQVLATILEIKGLSAHGDQNDLLNWLSDLEEKPKKIFIVHGENEPAEELGIKIEEKYGYECSVAMMGQEIEL